MPMIGIMKLLLPLLLLFSAFVVPTTSKSKNRHESAAASSSLERGARVNKKWNAHHSHAAGVMQQRSNVTPTASHHEGGQSATSSDRRVIPWVSIAILMNILFFFRSFAAPFFDPLGEPRQATASSVYFSLLAFLYLWLASATVLTVLPQFSTNYNIIIAAALFFYMVFVSTCALLLGRLAIRGVYYIWLFWKIGGRRSNHSLESRLSGLLSTLSSFIGLLQGTRNQHNGENVVNDNRKGSRVNFVQQQQQQQQKEQFPVLIAFQRPFRRLFRSSVALSAGLCFIYSHCWSRTLSAFDVSRKEGGLVCQAVFLPMVMFGSSSAVHTTGRSSDCHLDYSCADERSIWILWAAAIIGHLWAYATHEFGGKHRHDYHNGSQHWSKQRVYRRGGSKYGGPDADPSSSRSSCYDLDSPIYRMDSNEMINEMEEEDVIAIDNITKRHSIIGESISATIQKFSKTKPEQPEDVFPMVSWYSNVVFSTGFDMLVSLKIFLGRFDARKMQVALLNESMGDFGKPHNKASDKIYAEGVFDFSCGKNSNIGEESDGSQENGFWFDFVSDCGDGFNSSYQVSRILAQPTLNIATASIPSFGRRTLPRGKLLINGGDLAYPDPNSHSYEKRFFRTFEDAMPPPPSFRREHISIRKPALPVQGWSNGVKTGATELSNYKGPCAFLLPGNHDWFDGLATYTRYILSRDWLGGWLMPQRTSYFALKLPHGWWMLGCDLALDNDINIEQFQFFAHLAASMRPDDCVIIVSHVPHWVLNEYENHAHDDAKETHLSELVRTHLRGRVKLRLAGDLHHYTRHVPISVKKSAAGNSHPVLIVAGGGGAFLHPTHCFQDQIKVGKERQEYSRVCAYPSTKISRHLSWLNLWQFRWRNWRLDILWAITHFGICSSFFPLCGVYDDYLAFNPTHHLGYLIMWVFHRVLLLFVYIFVSGRVSLLFTLIIIVITYSFTDSSNLKWKTHLGWSMVHAMAHISSALICILFVECMAEFVVKEGLVVTESADGASNAQFCGTGLATSIYDEYTLHFSHTLEDFQLLNTTNSTAPPDLLPNCRFDEKLYSVVSSTFSWLYHEAPFLKTTLAVFDLPGIIGSTHVAMCDALCPPSGGGFRSDIGCTYSHVFLKYQQLDRITIVKYLSSIALYFVIFAVPIAGNVFGTWLAISLNFLNCQFDAGFSSLRMEHWKNFLRMHIDENGDLEIFAIGLNRVPKKWRRDPSWDGGEKDHNVTDGDDASSTTPPSWMWNTPSKWIPWRNSDKFAPQIIDYSKIMKVNSASAEKKIK